MADGIVKLRVVQTVEIRVDPLRKSKCDTLCRYFKIVPVDIYSLGYECRLNDPPRIIGAHPNLPNRTQYCLDHEMQEVSDESG